MLIGDSPVNRNISYSQPPKVHPKKGDTMGTCGIVSGQWPALVAYQTYPEVIIASFPNIRAISKHIRHQSRSEVSSKINGIASFPAAIRRQVSLPAFVLHVKQLRLTNKHQFQK